MFGVAAGGEVAAEAHGDGTGRDFGQAGYDDDVGRWRRPESPAARAKGTVSPSDEADDDVADGFAGFEVVFDVGIRVLMGKVMHGGSVLQARCEEAVGRRWSGKVFTGLRRLL